MTDASQPPPPTPRPARSGVGLKSLLPGAALVCLALAGVQAWRAQTRGAAFAQQQAAAQLAPIALDANQRNAAALQGRQVLARGQWIAGSTILLDNRISPLPRGPRVGYQVLTALQLQDATAAVLVNRGWVAAPRLRSLLPAVATPTGPQVVTGTARGFEDNAFALGDQRPAGLVWQHLREAEYRARSGLDALPVLLVQADPPSAIEAADGLVRVPPLPAANPALRHTGYALVWLLLGLVALFNWRALRQRGAPP